MKYASRLVVLALIASASPKAMAASATPEEAQRLAGLIESYLGKTPGVVAVAVNGDGYDLVIDAAPFFKTLESQGNSASLSPLRYHLTDQGGGKWLVTLDQRLDFSLSIEKQLQFKGSVGNYKSTGIFSAEMGAFESGHTSVADMTFVEDVTAPGQAPVHVDAAVKSLEAVSSASFSLAGGLDGSVTLTAGGFSENIDMPAPEGSAMPVHVALTGGGMSETISYSGLKWLEAWQIAGWFKDHPTEAAVKTGHAELAALMRKALPVFGSIKIDASMDNLEAGTVLGTFGAKAMRAGLVMNGAVADGLFGESLAVEGLTMPPGIVPPFANDIAPLSASIGFKVTDFDLAAPAKLLLDHLEKTSDDPSPEMQQQLQSALMPKGEVKITLDPGSLVSKALTVDYQGSMMAGVGTKPSGEAVVKAKGLDELIKILQAAPVEMGLEQGIYGILAAKGFGKTEADGAITWKAEMTREGAVTVNGVPMPGTGGAQ